MTLPQREPHLKYRYLTVLRYFMDVIFRRWPSRRGGQSYCLTSLPLPWPPLFPPPSSQSAQMGLQVGRGPAAMPGLAAKPATSEEPRTRVELAQEAVERQQKLVEMGVYSSRGGQHKNKCSPFLCYSMLHNYARGAPITPPV